MTAKALTLRLLRALGLVLVFALASSSALVLHLGLPASRRSLATLFENALDDALLGNFWIGGVERVDISGVLLKDVVVADPQGKRVLSVSSLRVQADVPKLVYDLLFGGEKITLVVDHVHIGRAEVHLENDPETDLPSIARAFTPRPTGKPTSEAPGRHVRFVAHAVELTRGFARGRLAGLPTLEVDVSSVRGSVRVTPAGAEIVVNRFGAIARGLGGADLRGIASLHMRAPGWVWSSFDGHFGDVELGALVRVDGERVMASFDIPRARPNEVRALLPEYPLYEDASVELEASGTLPVVIVRGKLQAGAGQVLATGPLRLRGGLATELEVRGKNVDLRVAIPEAPRTRLNLRGRVRVDGSRSPALVSIDATTQPTVIEELALPAADISATLTDGRFAGTGLLHEPGLPTKLRFSIEPNGAARVYAEAKRFRPERAPRLAALIPARGLADARVDVRIHQKQITLEGGIDLTDTRYGDAHLARGAITGTLRGSVDDLDALRVDATWAGSGLSVGNQAFTRVAGKINGPLQNPKVQAALDTQHGPRLQAEARIRSVANGARIDDLALSLRHRRGELQGVARRIEITGRRMDLQELELSGFGGTLRGSARVSPELVSIEAHGRDLNLAGLSRLLGVSTRPRGHVDLDVDLVIASDLERGTARLELTDVAIGAVDGLSTTIDAELDRGQLKVTARAELAAVGTAEARLDTTLAGSALQVASFRDMTGEAELSLAGVDLGFLGTLLATQGVLERIAGKLTTSAKFSREDSASLPNLSLTGFTQDLEVRLAHEEGAAIRSFEGLDLLFGANFDGQRGATDLNAQLVDSNGSLAAASATGTVDLAQARRAPQQLVHQLFTTDVMGKLLIGERSLADLPEFLRPPGMRGRLRTEVTLAGTLAEPELSARLSVAAFGLENARNQRPVDLCANLTFEPRSAALLSSGEAFLSSAEGARCSGQRILRYSANGKATRDASGALQPRGSVTLGLEGFPLDAVPGLGDAGISGRGFGTLTLTDLTGVAQLAASVELRDTRVQGVPVGVGKLKLQSDERSIGAALSLSHDGGELSATALGTVDRQSAVPTLDLKQPIFLKLNAQRANAVILSPLLRDVLSEIGGRVDADLTLTLIQQTSGEPGTQLEGALQGRVALENGNVQLAGLGLRLSDVSLKARAETVGTQTHVVVEELGGRGGRSRERVDVRDGNLWLQGLRLVRAEGTVDTTELPLMLEGVAQATATTRQGIAFNLERKPDRMQVGFNVPYLLVALPQSSGRDVISLEENASIEILQPLGEPTRRSGEGLPWQLNFELGQNVRLTRSDLDLPLTGSAQVLLAEEVSVTGDLDLKPGGRLQVSDRMFIIESGEVHFNTGDPANPSIRVTATWRAPDDTMVFATVSGTLRDPNLLPLTSSPSRSQDEIWALLLGYGGTDETSSPSAAGAIVGAQQLLAPILQNTPVSRVAIRADEAARGDRSYTTYTAAVPISDKVWFEGSYHAPNASKGEDYTGAVSGTVDWRFRPHWSLRTEVGTIGTGLDLVWQYRY